MRACLRSRLTDSAQRTCGAASGVWVTAIIATLALAAPVLAQSPPLRLDKGDHIVFLGNTTAERLQQYNYFETLLMARFPELDLVIRNLGWSGDTITLQPRPLNFGDAAKHLREQRPDVIIAFFGLDESFDGEAGVSKFDQELDAYLAAHLAARYNGREPPRVALVSPIAYERLPRLAGYVDAEARNRDIARYTEVMRTVAAKRRVTFVDLFTPTKQAMSVVAAPLTINGIHLNQTGDRAVATMLMQGLGLGAAEYFENGSRFEALEKLRSAIAEKNQTFFYRWRPVNAEYVVGRRLEPFGAVNFPPEMRQLDGMISSLEEQIWTLARAAQRPPAKGDRR